MPADRRPPVLMRAIDELEPVLAAYGYVLSQEHYDHSGAGSAFVVFAKRGGRMRLSWEGRDGSLRAETAPANMDIWRDVEAEASRPTRVIDRSARADEAARLAALRTAVDRAARAATR